MKLRLRGTFLDAFLLISVQWGLMPATSHQPNFAKKVRVPVLFFHHIGRSFKVEYSDSEGIKIFQALGAFITSGEKIIRLFLPVVL